MRRAAAAAPLAALLLLVALPACSSSRVAAPDGGEQGAARFSADARTALRQARALWAERGVSTYQYVARFADHLADPHPDSPALQGMRIMIRNGVEVGYTYVRTGTPADAHALRTVRSPRTAEALFAVVEEAIRRGILEHAEYDPTDGHLVRVDVSGQTSGPDGFGEFSILVSEFVKAE